MSRAEKPKRSGKYADITGFVVASGMCVYRIASKLFADGHIPPLT
jgi:hypothetical protein